MDIRRLRNNGRRKAQFGSQEGAILAAAGINAATQLISAGINSRATRNAAKEQATAMLDNAKRQAQAIKDQTNASKDYQLQAQEFIKEQNTQNRDLQKDIQMQLQLLTGAQNVNDRLEASKLKVKAGGKTIKLRNMNGNQIFSLRGANMPFRVTDGGGVIPIYQTPEGYDLYSIVGNDHEHYHKTRGGKYKSGVGLKFADGNVVEGEGNQNGNRGELMLVTPEGAFFISKHNINGVNPAKLVEQGMHPLAAHNIQEQEKAIIGLNDDGTKAKFGKCKFLAGGLVPSPYDMQNIIGPQGGVDTSGDTSVGVAYSVQNNDNVNNRRLRLGGKINKRTKAAWGWNPYTQRYENNGFSMQGANAGINAGNIPRVNTPSRTSTTTNSNSSWGSPELWGAGISALGNLGGAFIADYANRRAGRTLSRAYNQAGNILANAYNNLKTIDMNTINRDDYKAAHAMAAIQAPVSLVSQQIAGVDRQLQRRLRNIGRNIASSAAANTAMNNAEVDAQDMRDKIYAADAEQMQRIRQANAERVTQAALENARLDTEANKDLTQARLSLLQYNNDIENQRILGAAGALSEAGVNAAGAIANARTANGKVWSDAMSTSGLSFANSLSSMAKRKADLDNVLMGADTDAYVRYIGLNGTRQEKDNLIARFTQALNTDNLSDSDKRIYTRYISFLNR